MALFLVVLVLSLALSSSFSTRDNLEKTLTDFETALRYARDEAALKNAIVRLNIKLELPQKYSLEYGPDENFVLPPDLYQAEDLVTSNEEEDFRSQQQKELDKKFNRIQAFQQEEKPIPQGVKVIGGATTFSQKLVTEGRFAVYVYPTGEIDAGILLLASSDEVGSLEFKSFTSDYKIDYKRIGGPSATGDLIDQQFDTAEELYDEWRAETRP